MGVIAPRDYDEITTIQDDTVQEVYVSGASGNNKIRMDNMKLYMKGETKVLWTGPLSVSGIATSLNSGEAFGDWDLIIFEISLTSDTDLFGPVSVLHTKIISRSRSYLSQTEYMDMQRLSDTTFQLETKTVTAGNIQRIIGIKL